MSNILPVIGASGVYPLAAPFNTLLSAFDIYTCQSIRRLTDIISDSNDPYDLYYAPLNIPMDIYNIDLQNNICILGLQSGNGHWVHVPNSYLLGYPLVNGVKYTSLVLNVALGPLPDNEPLELVKSLINNLILDHLGVRSITKEAAVSNTSVIQHTMHDVFVAKRIANGKVINKTDSQKLRELQANVVAYTTKIADLENYIKTRL